MSPKIFLSGVVFVLMVAGPVLYAGATLINPLKVGIRRSKGETTSVALVYRLVSTEVACGRFPSGYT